MNFEEAYDDTCSSVGLSARTGDVELLLRLIEEGRPINVQDNRGWRPIHEAARYNHTNCLKVLLEHENCSRDDINCWMSFEGKTALYIACENGHSECVDMLIERGANVNDSMYIYKPIHAAVLLAVKDQFAENAIDCTRSLLRANADPNEITPECFSPLQLAAILGAVEAAKLLVSHGSLIDTNNYTPIYLAVLNENVDCMKFLVGEAIKQDKGQLMNRTCTDDATPLIAAVQNTNLECATFLLESGADKNIGSQSNVILAKVLPVHHALHQFHLAVKKLNLASFASDFPQKERDHLDKCEQILKFLWPQEPDDWKSIKENMSYVYHELFLGDFHSAEEKVLGYLIKLGINVNFKFTTKNDFPQKSNDLELLFKTRAYELSTPLACYLSKADSEHLDGGPGGLENMKCIEMLLKEGAMVNPTNDKEIPPLLVALEHSTIDVVQLVVDAGAELDIYHKDLIPNLTVLAAGFCGFDLEELETLDLILNAGAEAESLFISQDTCSKGRKGRKNTYRTIKLISKNDFRPHWFQKDGHRGYVNFFLHLLKFTTQVSVPSEFQHLFQSESEWNELLAVTSVPRSLSHLSRMTVRKALGCKRLKTDVVQSLGLPHTLVTYVLRVTTDFDED